MDQTSFFWTGQLYVGSNKDPINVAIDTSSDWLAIEGANCTECPGNTFDQGASVTASKLGTEDSTRKYNEFMVTGTEWQDTVCFKED